MVTDTKTERRTGCLSVHDSSLNLYEERVDEADLKKAVFDPVIRFLRSKGWKVGRDEQVHQHYRCLSPKRRYCRKGDLEASLELAGRSVKFEMFQNVANVSNPNGGKYDFDKMQRMPYLLRKAAELTQRQLIALLVQRHGYDVRLQSKKAGPQGITGREWIAREITSCCHYKPELGRADWHADYNRKTRDGQLLEHGQQIYFIDYRGRIGYGTAFYNLNNMWWILAGRYTVLNIHCGDIFAQAPADLRKKRNERIRRRRLEDELAHAVAALNFERAIVLKRVLFGEVPLFRIWSKRNDAYYGINFSGYTTDQTYAGKYTEQEVRLRASAIARGDLRLEPVAAAGGAR